MFEYLFKAKLKNEPRWVDGDLVRITDGSCIKTYIYGKGEVDPNTVCQFTGQIAKGVKIFDKDICRFYDDEGGYSDNVILWDEKKCRFIAKSLKNENILPDELDDFFAENSEVIGNIFDDPELT